MQVGTYLQQRGILCLCEICFINFSSLRHRRKFGWVNQSLGQHLRVVPVVFTSEFTILRYPREPPHT